MVFAGIVVLFIWGGLTRCVCALPARVHGPCFRAVLPVCAPMRIGGVCSIRFRPFVAPSATFGRMVAQLRLVPTEAAAFGHKKAPAARLGANPVRGRIRRGVVTAQGGAGRILSRAAKAIATVAHWLDCQRPSIFTMIVNLGRLATIDARLRQRRRHFAALYGLPDKTLRQRLIKPAVV